MKIWLTVNGLQIEAHYHDDEIEKVHKPLLCKLAQLHAANPARRTIIFLSAPPGTGKSTLTTFWEHLCRRDADLPEIQTLPMDGFHHYNSWLDAHNLRPYKGAPETFDVAKLAQNLQRIREGDGTWPQYDRQTHDPQEGAVQVTAPVVIVEGNWLLLDDDSWRTLAKYCDFSLFIHAPAHVLRDRLVGRKLAGGLSQAEADAFYLRTDGPNVQRVLENSLPANLTLEMTEDGAYRIPESLTLQTLNHADVP
ncbi:nucleoside/nucleotide kinase family protein [Kluyvera sp. STS39-E]|uniref:nucleoside/nucleotide kinase family protein n=1 Tax=Kluyvera sp. STS39-E TaxID=3234748 RepID=UPI0034C5FC07